MKRDFDRRSADDRIRLPCSFKKDLSFGDNPGDR